MIVKKYVFDNIEYLSESAVRQAIFVKYRVAFGKPKTAKEWLELGVTYTEEEEVIPLETLKSKKTTEIKREFLNWREQNATLISSLGFKVDSNERANTDVNGLLIAYESNQYEPITFRDADNQFHTLTYAQVKVLQKEIIENGNYAYVQKWTFDAQVENATTKEGLDAIELVFVGKDFTVKG